MLILMALSLSGCESYTPKPIGYFRIELPEKKYVTFESEDYPYSFEYADVAKIQEKKSKDGKKYTAYEREYFVDFTIDDIASQRHFTREVPISNETVEQLRAAVASPCRTEALSPRAGRMW